MAGEHVIEATDQTFEQEVLQSDTPTIVDFWAPWCGPCRQLTPLLEQMADEYNGKFRVAKVNVDQNQNVARAYNVTALPTLVLVKNGEVVNKAIGMQNRRALETFVQGL